MKTILILAALLTLPYLTFSQKVDGHISEKGENGQSTPVVGANLYWLGTTLGTTTNETGYFAINRPKGAELLVISFVGYQTDTLLVPSTQTRIMHTLQSSVDIEGVVVAGRAAGTHFDRVNPVQTQIITRNELERAACCNLSESFETNASVDVSYSDAVTGAKQIQLLGLAGTYSQIQVENIPALRGLASTFGLGYIPGSWMESIQVSKGTASVANGYESIAGQINVEYKKPWEDEVFFVNGYANSLGMAEFNTNFRMSVSPKVSTMVLAHVENMSFENDHNHDTFLNHPLVKQYHLLNRWKYDGNSFESQVGIRLLDEDRSAGQLAHENIINPFGIDIQTRQYEGFGKAGYIFDRPNTSLGLIASASMHDQQSVFGQSLYTGRQQSLYSNLVFITYIGRTNHTIKTGVSFTYDDYSESLNNLSFDRIESTPGAYLEYTYKWLEDFSLMAGARVDRHNMFGTLFTPRLHMRYQPIEQLNLRASVGKGYRSPSVIAENMYLLASSRNMVFLEDIGIEEAWNFGINITQKYMLWFRELTINTDFYRTSFANQLIVDMDRDPTNVYFYNLDGESYSNSLQAEVSYSPFHRFDFSVAYRWNDVRTTINGELQEKPLVSQYKGFFTTSYQTESKWQLDYTLHLNGGGRLPNTNHLPEELYRGESFPSFITMNAQVSKTIDRWDVYIGVENLTGYTQKNPIISSENPYSPFFDASMVWGPLTGRKFYIGFRYAINRQ
ncbi:TonB-dependent receptor [Perlabentimonas gracilis]|uniref:TonB-dependent receptor n=1 Tax=Perlabentimonas gracilis TaxID=2715279 RepID=UPI00140E1CB1|nr:TonB-dependent receptor [Perlabentimonas gracilis]NHB69788.1 TonB-dependent receptor [Perlabentimonas gracilis]